jgi:hypothetical protein
MRGTANNSTHTDLFTSPQNKNLDCIGIHLSSPHLAHEILKVDSLGTKQQLPHAGAALFLSIIMSYAMD